MDVDSPLPPLQSNTALWDQPWGPKCLGSGPSEPPEILPEPGRSLHIRSILSSGGISVLSNH